MFDHFANVATMDRDHIKTWQSLVSTLPEAQRRWAAAQKAIEHGRGGIEFVHRITGISRTTIIRGMDELRKGLPKEAAERSRRLGGGRKPIYVSDPKILVHLRQLIESDTAGDPMSALMWTHKTYQTLADALVKLGHKVTDDTVGKLLELDGYSSQVNKKSREGKSQHVNRDAQFKYINAQAEAFMNAGLPVISVDSKKRELVGNFKNAGKTHRPKGKPLLVNAYDFRSEAEGIALPYGCYDLKRNAGFVNVGVSSDTAEFAVDSIDLWWRKMGKSHYQKAKALLICADGGGSNGSRNRLWKFSLQAFASRSGLEITVAHYPPGTSKWNKIEHRLFSFISLNWQGRPLQDYATVVNLIAHTTTRKGLKVKAQLSTKRYETGVKVDDDEMDDVLLYRHRTHPEWNYTIFPQKPAD